MSHLTFFCSSSRRRGTHLEDTLRYCRSFLTMFFAVKRLILNVLAKLVNVTRRSFRMAASMAAMRGGVREVRGLPLRGASCTRVVPVLYAAPHRKTLALDSVWSLNCA